MVRCRSQCDKEEGLRTYGSSFTLAHLVVTIFQQYVYVLYWKESNEATITNYYRYRVSGHAPTVPHSTDEDDQEGRIHFQKDGAHPHYLGEVREYLNTRFPGRWIGRAAPIA
jgi:hypothetical protein